MKLPFHRNQPEPESEQPEPTAFDAYRVGFDAGYMRGFQDGHERAVIVLAYAQGRRHDA